MRNLKLLFLLAFTVSVFYSCTKSKTQTEQNQVVDMHTSEIALDWAGTYTGDLPCADCDKIVTTVILNSDLTYVLIRQYIDADYAVSDTLKGGFIWQDNIVKLDNISQDESPTMFKVEENQLRQLDLKGEIVTGDLADYYLLKKIDTVQ